MTDIKNDLAFIAVSYHQKYKNVINTAIIPAIEANALKASIATGKDRGSRDIYQDIADKIYHSKIDIADVSKKYDDNGNLIELANVFYEIGLAHGINKRLILLCRKGKEKDDIPYNLQRVSFLAYDPDDLFALKKSLTIEIQKTLNDKPVVFFNQFKILTENIKKELEDLRFKAQKVRIEVFPEIADIFFNDQFLGQTPQTIYVNTNKLRNTISIVAPGHIEEHRVLKKEDLQEGVIKIKLQEFNSETFEVNKKIVGWLRDRRIDTNNPVLMRAIAQYLFRLSKVQDNDEEKQRVYDDARKEMDELLTIAPSWYLAQNQMGIIHKHDFNLSIKYYKITTILNPDSYLGYYNQACAYARAKKFDEVFRLLSIFLENKKVLWSYSYTKLKLLEDSAFDTLKEDHLVEAKFIVMANQIVNEAQKLKDARIK